MAARKDEAHALPVRVSVRLTKSAPGAPDVIEMDRVEAIRLFLRCGCEFVEWAPLASELAAEAGFVFEQLEAERGRMGEGDWIRIPAKRRAYERLGSVLEGSTHLGGDAA